MLRNGYRFNLLPAVPVFALFLAINYGGVVEATPPFPTENKISNSDITCCQMFALPFRGLPGGQREAQWIIRDGATALALQTDGKIVVGGESDRSFALVRYTGDGGVDKSFGDLGKVMTVLGLNNGVRDLVLSADGKIVVTGQTYSDSTGNDFAVLRYNGDGTPDVSFGVKGLVTTDIPSHNLPPPMPRGNMYGYNVQSSEGIPSEPQEVPSSATQQSAGYDDPFAIAVQKDGKLVVAGGTGNGGVNSVALVRYRQDGTVDSQFGSDGKVVSEFDKHYGAYALALQTDEKIIVVGGQFYNQDPRSPWVVLRYNSDGTLDSSFGNTGRVFTHIGDGSTVAYALTLQSDGKILVVGNAYDAQQISIVLARYNGDGSADASFGEGGKVIVPVSKESRLFGSVYAFSRLCGGIALQRDGKIVITVSTDHGVVVLRYNADGSLDTSFGENGKAAIHIGVTGDSARAVALQTNGKIVVAGECSNARHSNIFLLRYNPDGSLDRTFGKGGKVITRIGIGFTVS